MIYVHFTSFSKTVVTRMSCVPSPGERVIVWGQVYRVTGREWLIDTDDEDTGHCTVHIVESA